jgi:prepilin-type N-terminal cleavage/methylation domain-containing protein
VRTNLRSDTGFTLIEMLVATAILLIVSSIVTSALMQMTTHQQTISNRTEMHSGVRGATELLQQEVGQAGRVTVPAPVTLAQAVNAIGGAAPAAVSSCDPLSPATNAVTVNVSSATGMFASAGPPAAYEILTVLDGDTAESVVVVNVVASAVPGASTIQACFTNPHLNGAVIAPMGGFATGIVPPTMANGSTANKLKLYGDINGAGKMVYIEYYCDNGDAGTAGSGNLYRNVMDFDTAPAAKPALTDSMILLSNVHPNPVDAGGAARPCFQYQTASVTIGATVYTFVLDVAVTLTVWTQQADPVTHQFQTETKALLNISPRNVFSAWELASLAYTNRIQPTPATVVALLP